MTPRRSANRSKVKSTFATRTTEEQQDKNNSLFPIVGIGASAGGLEAFTQLLKHLPIDTGMGFVLIQHLAPNTKSLLTEILARTTQMPVAEVKDGMSVAPNHIYIIPPNKKMVISQGVLKLTPRENTDGKHMPIDSFFVSLAKDRGSLASAVVLSGGDGDGALGLKDIKAAGGITFAQCEDSAKVHSMPHTAAMTGIVDFILSPKEIALELARISHHPYITQSTPEKTVAIASESKNILQQIFTLLRNFSSVDFSNYKQTSLLRRLMRRVILHKLSNLEDYLTYLQKYPDEVEALFNEILINVTSFFRNPEIFEALKESLFPLITLHKSPSQAIRIWVAGCSTGEEAYSLAICLLEFFENGGSSVAHLSQMPKGEQGVGGEGEQENPQSKIQNPKSKIQIPPIKIFASDISDTALEKARTGIYTARELGDVSPERLQRFFVEVKNGYQIAKRVRELCIFAKQNLSQDPPFSKLDLIVCRNVLIYFSPTLQKQVFKIFHYSLNPGGFLWLGPAESPGEFSELFNPVDKKHKIYSSKLASQGRKVDFITSNYPLGKDNSGKKSNLDTGSNLDKIQQEADRIVLGKYAPVGVIINNELDIIQFRGETSPFLRPAPGKPSFNILKMAHEDLVLELRTGIHQAKKQDVPFRKSGLQIKYNEQLKDFILDIIPFKVYPAVERCYLVLFQFVIDDNINNISNKKPIQTNQDNGKQQDINQEINQFKKELADTKEDLTATKEYLESIIEDQEITNQDLKIANEEILSSNEEFQSINEELETAKEELQATNEELNTINEELRIRNIESTQFNNDLMNLLNTVNIPIVMLGGDLNVRRFTPMAEKIINLLPNDIGRPFSNLKPNINVPNLNELILEALNTAKITEQEVQDFQGHWYELRIFPYKTQENQTDGAVIVLIDINELKKSAELLKEARDYSESIVKTVQAPLIVLDANLNVKTANEAFYEEFNTTIAETENKAFFEIGNGDWNIPELEELLLTVIPTDRKVKSFEINHVFEKIGAKTILVNACKIPQEGDEIKLMLLALEDITERKQLENELAQLLVDEQAAREVAEAANRTKDEFLSILSHELRTPMSAILMWTQLLRTRKFDNSKTTRALEMLERSAKSQYKLIEDLLDLSRITSGKLLLKPCVLEFAHVINAAIDVAELAAEAKNIQIVSKLNPQTGKIVGDPHRLQQVIWNLLSNAIKFTPAGGGIEIELEPVDSHAEIRVSDTGIGIGAEFLPYVFDRFRQGDSTSTRAHGGLGLGLTIVRHLIELHGGTVRAESPGEGQGTTIIVRLPLIANQELSPLLISDPFDLKDELEATSAILPSLKGLRVLVVDDDVILLEVLKTMLEEYGVEVTAIASANEAMEAIAANPGVYDLLISDLAMPEEDGYTLIRWVRALSPEQGGQIPAVALTAYVREEDRREALKAGFQMHIAKPVAPAHLASIVARLAGTSKD
jgi:two-component system CheB/CheR fusion protein